MWHRILGAHPIPSTRLYSVARVRSVTACLLAIGMGCWIIYHQNVLLRTKAWEELYAVLGGNVALMGWIILFGGVLGVLGLFLRQRAVSLISCVICIAWCAWAASFLWYSNFTDAPNIVGFMAFYALLEYVYRFALLVRPPKSGEEYVEGW